MVVGALIVPFAISAVPAAASAKTLYMSPSGSDGAGCTSSSPCKSFDAAYKAAAPGDTVSVAGGTYAGGTIAHDANKTTGNITFQPASGATVTLSGGLQINGSYLTIKNFKGTDFTIRTPDQNNPPAVTNVTLSGVDGRNFNIFSATHVNVLGGDWGPASDCGGPYGGSNNSIRKLSSVNPSDIVIDGVKIHDVQSYDLNACHIEGLAIFAGQNVIVRNSKFYGNSIYDIFLQANSGPISGVTLENNWFANPVGTNGSNNGSSLGFSGVNANVTIRNNSLNGVASFDDNGNNPTFTNFVVTGNIGQLPYNGCSLRGITWSYNVWQNGKCGSNDVNLNGAALPYKNRAQTSAADYHLTGGAAVDLIPDAASPLTRDIDDDARPEGSGIDAGADEMGGSAPAPDPTPTPSPSPSPSPAPSGGLYLSPSGNDANACSQAAPCKTLSRGYKAARPGQTVYMNGGSYADTTIATDSTKTSSDNVLFTPLSGATVTMTGTLHVPAAHLTLNKLKLQKTLWIDATASDVSIRKSTLPNFKIFSDAAKAPTNISFLGGSIGPSTDDNNIIGSNGTSTTASPTKITLDGVLIHDYTLSPGSSAHVECLQVWAAQGLTIRNSTFRNCEVFNVFLQKLPGGAAPTPSKILIENNFMDCCRSGYFSIRLADHAGTSWKDVTIRNNSTNKAINPDGGVPYSNVKIINNIAPKLDLYTGATGGSSPKPAGLTVNYNVWYSGSKIGTRDQVAPSGFVNPATFDFHLKAGAAAINNGSKTGSPGKDIDGQARPMGGTPDAGADEKG